MTALLTQCPHCQTSFRVSTAQMNAAHGLVRCGSCLGVFSAAANEIRIRTPDGYLVEEIDPDEDTEQSFSEEPANGPADTIDLPDEDVPLPTETVDTVAEHQTPASETADIDPFAEQPSIADTPFARGSDAIAGEELLDDEATDNEGTEAGRHSDPADEEDGLFVVAAAPAPPAAAEEEEPLFVTASAAAQPAVETSLADEAGYHDDNDDGVAEATEEAADEATDETSEESLPWHDEHEPVITLGDMRLDELEDGDQEDDDLEYSDSAHPAKQAMDDSDEHEAEEYPHDEHDSAEEHPDEYGHETGRTTDGNHAADDDYNDDYIEPEPAAATSGYQRLSTSGNVTAAPEKQNLHQRLSALTDDEFDPVDDDQLDTLDSLPVTITQGDNLRGRLAQAALMLLAVLLLAALPLPWLYAERNTLATHPRFAFMAPLTCRLFGCTPAATLDLGAIYSQQLLVRSHPRYQGALEVSFIFHNDTTLPRPFPLVELAFSDLSNNLLANRLFKPQEYLPAELRQLNEMPANSTVQVTLELEDPGKEAVNYTVKLHPPTP